MVKSAVDKAKGKDIAENLIATAQECFGQMQRSWWGFAKSLHYIKTTRYMDGKIEKFVYEKVAENFKDFCEKEYPSLSYQTIFKLVSVVEKMGESIEARIKKDDDYQPPSYDACYQLTTLKEDKVPKEEFSKLKKMVLDNKMSFQKLRDELKGFLRSYRTRVSHEVDREALEEEVLEDIGDELEEYKDDESEPILDEFHDEPDSEEEEDETPSLKSANIIRCANAARTLIDNLPEIKKVTGEVVALAEIIDNLSGIVDDFLTHVEEEN
jgi:hypothetical protein